MPVIVCSKFIFLITRETSTLRLSLPSIVLFFKVSLTYFSISLWDVIPTFFKNFLISKLNVSSSIFYPIKEKYYYTIKN